MHNIDDGTVGGLVIYLDDLIANNRMEASKITPLKSAVKRVFSCVDSCGWKSSRVDKVDTDEQIRLFKYYCKGIDFDEGTFAAYRARINRALKWYKNYLADHAWSPFKKETALEKLLGPYLNLCPANSAKDDSVDAIGIQMVTYPFPLSDGSLASLYLPKRLSQEDAERLRMFIGSLALREGGEHGKSHN